MSKRYFFDDELKAMSENPNKRAKAIGDREPYYLTYLRQNKPNTKPEDRNNGRVREEHI